MTAANDDNDLEGMSRPSRSPEGDPLEIVVSEEHAGQRFDAFLANSFSEYSRVRLRQVINAAAARVNDRRKKAAYRLRVDDVITVTFPEVEDRDGPQPENIPLDILFEDECMAVINKPTAMVVHPAKGHWSGTLTSALAYHFKNLSTVGGPTRPGIVHRLDRDTSGVIVVAKTDQAHRAISQQFEQRTVKKEYFAVSRGSIDRDRDTIDMPIGSHPYQREKMAIRANHTTSRDAHTFFEVTERFAGFTVFRVMPRTGRTHQIRVHLSHIGCPVLCDPLYSGHRVLTMGEVCRKPKDATPLISRLVLHARRIQLQHPVSGDPIEFSAELPDEIETLLAELRRWRSL